jgi:glutamate racemase
LKPVLHRVVPEGVTLVDSAESTALAVGSLLEAGEDAARSKDSGAANTRFFVTDSAEKFHRLGTLFLGREIRDITHVDLKE